MVLLLCTLIQRYAMRENGTWQYVSLGKNSYFYPQFNRPNEYIGEDDSSYESSSESSALASDHDIGERKV